MSKKGTKKGQRARKSTGKARDFWKRYERKIVSAMLAVLAALLGGSLIVNIKGCSNNSFNFFIGCDGVQYAVPKSCEEELKAEGVHCAAVVDESKEQKVPDLCDPSGLQEVADKAYNLGVAGKFGEAVEMAKIGQKMIDPIITPHLNTRCSIETKFAENIKKVYYILAEDAWSRDDYALAKKYVHLVLGIWGPRISGDFYGIAVAIEVSECGGTDSVLCGEAVKRYRAGDKVWLHGYFSQLAKWGYAHPVGVDPKTGDAYLVRHEEIFGIPWKLQYRSLLRKQGKAASVKVYHGLGRLEEWHIPDPNGRRPTPEPRNPLILPTAKKGDGRARGAL